VGEEGQKRVRLAPRRDVFVAFGCQSRSTTSLGGWLHNKRNTSCNVKLQNGDLLIWC